jgi:threonylcarbamoyladenosine tRNA methylthiotransferase MtaB
VEDCGLTWLHVFPYSARKGTPAARMPMVDKAVVKERAARLRAVGDAAQAKYLAAQVGATHRAIMEKPRLGRTESFAEVVFDEDRTVGEIVNVAIVGVEGVRLIGV